MLLHAWYNDGVVDINTSGQTAGDAMPYFWQAVAPLPLDKCGTVELAHLRPAMLTHLLALYAQRPLFVKTHHCFADADDIPLIPPALTKTAWYVVRDPRDVVVSAAHHFKLDYDEIIDRMGRETYQISHAGCPVAHYMSSWRMHVRSWLMNAPQYFEVKLVKYERLLEDAETVFFKLLETSGLEPDAHIVEKCVDACRFENLQAQERLRGFGEAVSGMFFRNGTAGQWKTELSSKQVKRVETDHRDVMEQLGYLSTKTAKSPKTKKA